MAHASMAARTVWATAIDRELRQGGDGRFKRRCRQRSPATRRHRSGPGRRPTRAGASEPEMTVTSRSAMTSWVISEPSVSPSIRPHDGVLGTGPPNARDVATDDGHEGLTHRRPHRWRGRARRWQRRSPRRYRTTPASSSARGKASHDVLIGERHCPADPGPRRRAAAWSAAWQRPVSDAVGGSGVGSGGNSTCSTDAEMMRHRVFDEVGRVDELRRWHRPRPCPPRRARR